MAVPQLRRSRRPAQPRSSVRRFQMPDGTVIAYTASEWSAFKVGEFG